MPLPTITTRVLTWLVGTIPYLIRKTRFVVSARVLTLGCVLWVLNHIMRVVRNGILFFSLFCTRSQQGGNDSVVISQHGPIDENETASHGLAAGRVPSFGGLSRHRPTLSNNLSEDRSRGRKKGARRRVFSKHLERVRMGKGREGG